MGHQSYGMIAGIAERAEREWTRKDTGLGRVMRQEMGCGFQTVVRLISLYAAEVVALTAIHKFLPPAWFRRLLVPVIIAVIAAGWVMILVQMRRKAKKG